MWIWITLYTVGFLGTLLYCTVEEELAKMNNEYRETTDIGDILLGCCFWPIILSVLALACCVNIAKGLLDKTAKKIATKIYNVQQFMKKVGK